MADMARRVSHISPSAWCVRACVRVCLSVCLWLESAGQVGRRMSELDSLGSPLQICNTVAMPCLRSVTVCQSSESSGLCLLSLLPKKSKKHGYRWELGLGDQPTKKQTEVYRNKVNILLDDRHTSRIFLNLSPRRVCSVCARWCEGNGEVVVWGEGAQCERRRLMKRVGFDKDRLRLHCARYLAIGSRTAVFPVAHRPWPTTADTTRCHLPLAPARMQLDLPPPIALSVLALPMCRFLLTS